MEETIVHIDAGEEEQQYLEGSFSGQHFGQQKIA
jgi:hypothetical protein